MWEVLAFRVLHITHTEMPGICFLRVLERQKSTPALWCWPARARLQRIASLPFGFRRQPAGLEQARITAHRAPPVPARPCLGR